MQEIEKLYEKFSFSKTLDDDKVFLLSMLDVPVNTLKAYNMEAKDVVLRVLDGIAAVLRSRSIELFSHAGVDEACQHCQCCGLAGAEGIRA